MQLQAKGGSFSRTGMGEMGVAYIIMYHNNFMCIVQLKKGGLVLPRVHCTGAFHVQVPPPPPPPLHIGLVWHVKASFLA